MCATIGCLFHANTPCNSHANEIHWLAEALVSKVKGKKVVRRSKRRKTVTSSPASLPPQVPDVDASAAVIPPDAEIVPAPAKKKKFWEISKDTACYQTTMKILAMRVA